MKSNYLLRLESSIKRALSEILNFEVKNNIGLVTVTECSITSDLEYLTVYYTVLSDKDKKRAREGLESSKGFIRSSLASKVQMRKVPNLIFKYDDSYQNRSRIEELLKEAKAKEIVEDEN
ncbi:30S ribosome-binding factor RbfA [bacterium]|nr:30S ribosome-binding factor RbfA [bacterium]